ncbi:hypothetical protein E2562_022184 [Oryza meyeriana var. granulata]|uniref:Uncharacterized protein n=1 Tax=Oryza meyeriana var. granulata TaxID=110450 RepID=A0A6G1DMG1_9ORYZ|nr:hypothetical protein E2562_022184 [Oryza meyeriana var. granulata]
MVATVGPSPSKAKQRVDPAPAKVTQRVGPPTKVSQRETKPEVQPLPQNPKVPVRMPIINQQQTDACQPKEEPCFSGRNAEAASVPVVPIEKQSKSDRKKSRKAEKKEKKFKDLFVTWDPPPIEKEDMDLADQNWLLGSTRKPGAGIGKCREIADPVPSQLAEQFLLQPRAIHLPDLHVYQLPYVVPF